MKNIIFIILILNAFSVNAQDCFLVQKDKVIIADSFAFFYNYDVRWVNSREVNKEDASNTYWFSKTGSCLNCETLKPSGFETIEVMSRIIFASALDSKSDIWLSNLRWEYTDFRLFYRVSEE